MERLLGAETFFCQFNKILPTSIQKVSLYSIYFFYLFRKNKTIERGADCYDDHSACVCG